MSASGYSEFSSPLRKRKNASSESLDTISDGSAHKRRNFRKAAGPEDNDDSDSDGSFISMDEFVVGSDAVAPSTSIANAPAAASSSQPPAPNHNAQHGELPDPFEDDEPEEGTTITALAQGLSTRNPNHDRLRTMEFTFSDSDIADFVTDSDSESSAFEAISPPRATSVSASSHDSDSEADQIRGINPFVDPRTPAVEGFRGVYLETFQPIPVPTGILNATVPDFSAQSNPNGPAIVVDEEPPTSAGGWRSRMTAHGSYLTLGGDTLVEGGSLKKGDKGKGPECVGCLRESINPAPIPAPSMEEDRLFAIRLANEERRNIQDMEIARYLTDSRVRVNEEITFDDLAASGFVAPETLVYLSELNTSILMAEAAPVEPVDSEVSWQDVRSDQTWQSVDEADDEDEEGMRTPVMSKGKDIDIELDGSPLLGDEDQEMKPTTPLKQTVERYHCIPSEAAVYQKCGICFDYFQPVTWPLLARGADKYGLSLSCSGVHAFCIDCMSEYVQHKLRVPLPFPVKCPACPKDVQWEMTDDDAMRILDQEWLERWHRAKILVALGPDAFYCPNKTCSHPLEPMEDNLTIAECPMCHCSMCFKCKVIWHSGFTCEEYKLVNENQTPEDRLLYLTAKNKYWRRCPRCKMIVEKNEGCNHMTCVCRHEFCWLCGAGKCPGNCGNWQADRTLIMPGEAGPSRPRQVVAPPAPVNPVYPSLKGYDIFEDDDDDDDF